MKKIRHRILAWTLSVSMVLGYAVLPDASEGSTVEAADIPVRETTADAAGTDQILIGVEGMDYTSDMETLLNRVNEVRKKACDEGDPDPRDSSRNLEPSDYVPIKIGVNTSKAAAIRAAEGAIRLSHTRPDDTSTFTCIRYFNSSSGGVSENLAWNGDTASDIEGWIDERNAWLGLKSGQTGHYETLINPNYRYTGMATFNPTNDSINYDWSCTAGSYAVNDTELTSLPGKKSEAAIQKILVSVRYVQDMAITGEAILHVGETANAGLLVTVYFPQTSANVRANTTVDCPVYDGVTWESLDTSILTVDADGTIQAKKTGQATLVATIGSGTNAKTLERTMLVVPDGVTVTGVEDPDTVYAESYQTPNLSKSVKATLSNGTVVNVDVKWESYDRSNLQTHFTSIEFDVPGKALGFDVTQHVHILPAEIEEIFTAVTNPDYDPSDSSSRKYIRKNLITVDSGTMPENVQAAVTLSNNLTWYFPASWSSTYYVTWDKTTLNHYKERLGGDFDIEGILKLDSDDGKKEYPIVQKLHVNPATVTDVVYTEDEVTTDSGVVPDYPKATVTWSNGDVTEEDVIWQDADPTSEDRKYMIREGGDYTLTGSYSGYATTITVHVNPATPKSASIPVAEQNKTVPSGTPAELTETATITWSNGDTTGAGISWNAQSHDDYGKIDGGSYVVTGKAEGLTVSVNVTVLPAKIRSVEALTGVATVQKVAPILPETVHVIWSNDDETDEVITWNAIPASAYADPDTDFSVSGTITDFDGKKTTVTVTVHVNARALTSIAWKNGSPTGATSYYQYRKQDLTGVIVAYYDNEETEEIILTPAMITGFDADSKKSTQTVTVTYTDAGISKTLTAQMHLIQRIGIRITALPGKTDYIEEEVLDTEGLALAELLDNDTERAIGAEELETAVCTGYTMTPADYGEQTVTVKLGEHTDTFTITVRKKQLAALDITALPKQMTYVTTQPLNMAGLTVKAVYDNQKTKTLTVTPAMLREELELTQENIRNKNFGVDANTDTAGTHRIYVLYSESEDQGEQIRTIYVAVYFDITVLVKKAESIEFKKAPAVTEYPEGDVHFSNFDDATLLVHNNNEYDEVVPITDAVISGFDINTIGPQEVTVSYDGQSLTFDAVVRAKQVDRTYVIPPTRISFTEEEVMDLSGGFVVIEYDNGTSEKVALNSGNENLTVAFDDESSITEPMTEGKRKLLVSWKGEALLTEDGKEITIDVIHKVLQKIEWKAGSPVGDTSYYTYRKEDLTGTLLATYDNGDVEEVALTPAMITTFDPDSQKSTQNVVITYSYAGVSVTMTAKMKLVKRIGIRLSKAPTKLSYIEGEVLETAGFEVTELLDNNTERTVSAEEAAAGVFTGFKSRPKNYGTQTITYTLGDFSDTFSVSVRKKELDSLLLISEPEKVIYAETQPLELTGLSVQAVYDNGDKAAVNVTADMLREGITAAGLRAGNTGTKANTKGVGTHTMSVLYSEKDAEGSIIYTWVSFEIEVLEKQVQSIKFAKAPSKTEYPEGDV
ncbi:MAG: bacterial Ig-like domain-containing protein, partial [Eubacterium sp.]|nr:bacterial Ig-like domain-containing protein [Eubacterium sp.]